MPLFFHSHVMPLFSFVHLLLFTYSVILTFSLSTFYGLTFSNYIPIYLLSCVCENNDTFLLCWVAIFVLFVNYTNYYLLGLEIFVYVNQSDATININK